MNIAGVKDSIVECLGEPIIVDELAAGQTINEIQLAAAFHISRPPLHSQGFHKEIIEQTQAGAFDQAKVVLSDHLRTFVGIWETGIKEQEPQNMEKKEV